MSSARSVVLMAYVAGAAGLSATLAVGPARAGWFWEGNDQDQEWDRPRYHRPYDEDEAPSGRRVWIRRGNAWYADPYVEYDRVPRRPFYDPDADGYAAPESARPAPTRRKSVPVSRPATPSDAAGVSTRVTAAPPPAPNGWRPGALNVVPGQLKSTSPVAPTGTAPSDADRKPVAAPSESTQAVAEARASGSPAVPVPRPNLEGLDFAPAAAIPSPVAAAPGPPIGSADQREEDPR